MPLFADSKQEIFSDVLNDVLSNTNITQTSPGTKARAFVEAVTNKLGDIWNKFDLNMAHAFLDGAEGKYLDYFGDMFGVVRIGEKPASVIASDKVVRFYRAVGDTVGEIPIPQGTTISTLSDAGGISYVTTEYATLLSGETEIYVSARAKDSGESGNLSRDSLIYHNVLNPSGVTSTLFVTNEADIVTGRGLESDSNFRFRISKQVLSSESGNLTAIRMACLAVPGVADVQLMPFFRGVGTFDVLVKATTPSVSDSLLNNVREALYFTIAQGVSYSVRRPKETGVSMGITITLKEPISKTQETEMRSTIQRVLYDYVNNLDISEELVINEIVQRVMAVDDNIKNMGTAGKPIDSITLYKENALRSTRIPKTLFSLGNTPTDYVPSSDEKLLIELTYIAPGINPIAVSFNT